MPEMKSLSDLWDMKNKPRKAAEIKANPRGDFFRRPLLLHPDYYSRATTSRQIWPAASGRPKALAARDSWTIFLLPSS